MKKIFIGCSIMLLTISSASAQDIRNDPIIYQPVPDSPILSRNSALTGKGEAFDFLIGDWDVIITWREGKQDEDIYRAKWHNHWIIDGHAVMQEWRGPSITGAEIRFYDLKTQSWRGRNIYVNGDWRRTEAKPFGDNLEVIIYGHNEERGDFLNRETYFNIKQNNFEMKSDISLDNGQSWQEGDYHMVVERSVAK